MTQPGADLEPLRVVAAQVLDALRGERLLLWSNPGNAGDALIRVATDQAFARAGLEGEQVRPDGEVAGRTVLIIGGGNLVPLYGEADRAFVDLRRSGAERIIVLPHTIRGEPTCLAVAGKEDVIGCRDAPSEEVVRASGTAAATFLGHDMAFHLDAASFLADPGLARIAEPALAAATRAAGVENVAKQDVAVLTRTDIERGPDAPPSDADISALFAFGGGRLATAISAWCFLTYIDRCRSIVTDRLHVAIGSSLVGTPCVLLPNSYDKNAAVYEHSLRTFPNVSFATQWPR